MNEMKKVLFHLLFIIFCFTNLRAAHIDTLLVESRSMNKSIPNLVILPDAYDAQKQPFPVLYLLHGASGDFMDWLNKVPALKQYVDQYNFIIVCPDGGYTSWYFDSPIDEKMQYETYIADELVTNVDEKYNTFQDPAKRAISGLSMGGRTFESSIPGMTEHAKAENRKKWAEAYNNAREFSWLMK